MKKNKIFRSVFFVSLLSLAMSLLPFSINARENKINYSELQSKIIQGVAETSTGEYDDEITKGLPFDEKREVVIDLRNDLDTIKLSVSQPVTIYEEIITRTYDVKDITEYDDKYTRQSPTYETRTITTSKTYNGSTTTVGSILGYYMYSNVTVSGVLCDAFSLRSSNISFSSNGYGHVSLVRAWHHQRGTKYPSGPYTVVFDGNLYSAHRTYKTFSISASSGYANWSRYNSTYSALPKPAYSAGFVGSFYEVMFTWSIGGGGYEWDSIERTNGFGSLPS